MIIKPFSIDFFSADEVPGMNVPLHTVYKLTPVAYGKNI